MTNLDDGQLSPEGDALLAGWIGQYQDMFGHGPTGEQYVALAMHASWHSDTHAGPGHVGCFGH